MKHIEAYIRSRSASFLHRTCNSPEDSASSLGTPVWNVHLMGMSNHFANPSRREVCIQLHLNSSVGLSPSQVGQDVLITERERERVCVVPSLTHRQNFFAPNSFVSQALLWFGFSLRTTDLPMIRFSVVMPPTIWTFTCLLHPTLAQALPRLRGALLRPPDVLRCVTLFEGDRPRQRPRGFGSENRPVDRRFGQGGLP